MGMLGGAMGPAKGLMGAAGGALGAAGGAGGDDKQGGRCQQVMYFAPPPWMHPCPPNTQTTKVQPVYVPMPGYQPVGGLPMSPQYPFGMPIVPQATPMGYPMQQQVSRQPFADPLAGDMGDSYASYQ